MPIDIVINNENIKQEAFNLCTLSLFNVLTASSLHFTQA